MRAVHVKMTVATVLLGSYLVAGKLILEEVPVFTATFFRLVSAVVVLAVYVAWKSPGLERPGRRDSGVIFAQALLGVFLFSVLAMYGVKFTGAIEAGVILGTVPISICLVAVLFLRERLSGRRRLGIVIAVLGAAGINALSAGGSGGGGSNEVLGALLLVGAVLCEAVFVTFGKLLSRPIPPATLSLILAVVGTLMFAGPAAAETGLAELSAISWQTWALMVYTGVAINGVAVVLMYDSLDSVDTAVVAAFTALTPVSGAVLSVLLLGEELHAYHVAGMVLVVIGVYVVAGEKDAKRAAETAKTAKTAEAAAETAEAAGVEARTGTSAPGTAHGGPETAATRERSATGPS